MVWSALNQEENKMPLYETVFIARQDLSESQVKTITEGLEKILTENGGTIKKTEFWGLRTLAYKINKSRKGHYVLFQMDAPATALHEMERNIRLSEDIMRYISVKIDTITDDPTIMMDKGGDSSPRTVSKPVNNEDQKEVA